MQRKVIHYLKAPDGKPLAGRAVTFELLGTGQEKNTFYPKGKVAAISDADGLVEAMLWVNANSQCPVRYRAHLPSCEKFDFVISPGDTPIGLGALKESGMSWEDPKYLATVDYLKQNARDLNLGVTTEKSYTHIQDAIAIEWVIAHNLDKYPSVVVLDRFGTVVEGIPQYLDRNNLKLSFNPAIRGKAFLN